MQSTDFNSKCFIIKLYVSFFTTHYLAFVLLGEVMWTRITLSKSVEENNKKGFRIILQITMNKFGINEKITKI